MEVVVEPWHRAVLAVMGNVKDSFRDSVGHLALGRGLTRGAQQVKCVPCVSEIANPVLSPPQKFLCVAMRGNYGNLLYEREGKGEVRL